MSGGVCEQLWSSKALGWCNTGLVGFHESSFGLPLGIIAFHAISLGSRVREVSISLLCHRPSDRDSEILRPFNPRRQVWHLQIQTKSTTENIPAGWKSTKYRSYLWVQDWGWGTVKGLQNLIIFGLPITCVDPSFRTSWYCILAQFYHFSIVGIPRSSGQHLHIGYSRYRLIWRINMEP